MSSIESDVRSPGAKAVSFRESVTAAAIEAAASSASPEEETKWLMENDLPS